MRAGSPAGAAAGDGTRTNKEVTNQALFHFSARRYLESKWCVFAQTCHCETMCVESTGYPDSDTKTNLWVVSAKINVQCCCKSDMFV